MRLRFIEGEGEGGGGVDSGADRASSSDDSAKSADDEQLGDAGKKALAAERATVKDLRSQVKALEDAAKATAETKQKAEAGGDDVSERIAALEKQLADAEAARTAAEVSAMRTRLGAHLPADLLDLITGTTEDEIKAQVDTLAQHIKSGPAINPQQGTAGGKTGGSVTAGRDRYKAAHNN